jgi:hypothetical protein
MHPNNMEEVLKIRIPQQGGEDFLACHYENTTTEKVICNGLKLPSVMISEPLQMSRC